MESLFIIKLSHLYILQLDKHLFHYKWKCFDSPFTVDTWSWHQVSPNSVLTKNNPPIDLFQDCKYVCLSGFLFLRFFAPAILSPKLFFLRDHHPDKYVGRTLTLLAKVNKCFEKSFVCGSRTKAGLVLHSCKGKAVFFD